MEILERHCRARLQQRVGFSPTKTTPTFSFFLPRGTAAKHYFAGWTALYATTPSVLRVLLARSALPSSSCIRLIAVFTAHQFPSDFNISPTMFCGLRVVFRESSRLLLSERNRGQWNITCSGSSGVQPHSGHKGESSSLNWCRYFL